MVGLNFPLSNGANLGCYKTVASECTKDQGTKVYSKLQYFSVFRGTAKVLSLFIVIRISVLCRDWKANLATKTASAQ